jgi:hypothetical protein
MPRSLGRDSFVRKLLSLDHGCQRSSYGSLRRFNRGRENSNSTPVFQLLDSCIRWTL